MTSSTNKFLPYGRQAIDDDDIAAVVEVLRSDWLTSGPAVQQFEQLLAEQIGVEHAIACSSGTAALHMTMLDLDIGMDDIVIVPAVTFLATANAARYVGAEVCFADVDPHSGLMRAHDVEAAMLRCDRLARVVMPVHLNGQCTEMPAIAALAEKHGFAVVSDSCHALGSAYSFGDHSGMAGDGHYEHSSIYSFHPVKTIAMGEGGAVTTNDADAAERMRLFRNHGMTRDSARFINHEQAFAASGRANPWYYEMQQPGYNYRASDLHCALGLSQLKKLAQFAARRRELVALYDELLQPLADKLVPVTKMAWCNPAWHLYVVLMDFEALGIMRAEVMQKLHERGIGTQVHYMPLYRQPYYEARYGEQRLPGAEAYYNKALSLPLHAGMTSEDVHRVVDEIRTVLAKS